METYTTAEITRGWRMSGKTAEVYEQEGSWEAMGELIGRAREL